MGLGIFLSIVGILFEFVLQFAEHVREVHAGSGGLRSCRHDFGSECPLLVG